MDRWCKGKKRGDHMKFKVGDRITCVGPGGDCFDCKATVKYVSSVGQAEVLRDDGQPGGGQGGLWTIGLRSSEYLKLISNNIFVGERKKKTAYVG